MFNWQSHQSEARRAFAALRRCNYDCRGFGARGRVVRPEEIPEAAHGDGR